MKKLIYPVLAGFLLLTSAFVTITSQDWKIEDNYSIKFTSKDPSGSFKTFKGTINFDPADLGTAKFDLTIDVSSIDMGNGMKNKKAMTSEWFDEGKYPTIKYTSSKVEKSGDNYKLTGSLKMKGVTKNYTIPVKFSGNKFSGTFNVKRSDFGVGKASDVVPDILKIDFSVPVSKK